MVVLSGDTSSRTRTVLATRGPRVARTAMAIRIREAGEADLDFVIAAENEPRAAPLVGQWSRGRHRESIARADEEHLLILDDGEPVGFALLQGLGGENRSIEIRRIVVNRPGQGLGRRALALILDRAFADHGAHRVWLNTFTWNERAQRAYAAAGFVREGVLRDALVKDGRFESLVVMSILRPEWGQDPA
jgi:diamine N-acetyltransferase